MVSKQFHEINGILAKKNSMSRFIPMDAHTVIEVHHVDPDDCCISKVDSHIVKIDKRTGKVKRHLCHNTQHCK